MSDDEHRHPYEDHLETILAEGVEYMMLLFVRDHGGPVMQSHMLPFLRGLIRSIRRHADMMEIRVAFMEEKLEQGMTDEEAEKAYLEMFDEDNEDQWYDGEGHDEDEGDFRGSN